MGIFLPHCKSPYFEYHPGHGSSALSTLLSGKTQIVQSDGFSVYEVFDKLKEKIHIGCWAHAKRKFVEAENYDPPSTGYVLERIGKLYAVEKEIREKSLEKQRVVALRQKEAYPVIKELETWATENLLKTPHDSPLDKAIRCENGINIVEIKELMGHASLTSTMVYQDVTDEQKREAIKFLENNVTQTMKKKWTMPTNRSLAAMFGINVD